MKSRGLMGISEFVVVGFPKMQREGTNLREAREEAWILQADGSDLCDSEQVTF